MQLNHWVFTKVSDYIIEVSWVIIHDGPTTAPSWETVDLRNCSSANYWYSFCHITKWNKRAFRIITEAVIYFIRDYGKFEFFSNFQNLFHMFFREAWSTWIGWIVYQDSFSFWLDLSPKIVKINFPAFIWVQRISVIFNSNVLTDRLTEWEAWLWNKNTITDLAKYWDGVIESTRAAKAQEDMVWINWVFIIAKFFSNSITSDCSAWCLRVSIVRLWVYCLNDCFIHTFC